MKISIITASYNSAKTIEDTIKSVLGQTYQDIEYIVVDGTSKDGTLDIVKKYQASHEIKLLSEPDNGLYEAMNKGIALATGDVIGILNSDDFYKNNEVIQKIVTAFNESGADAVYADLEFVDEIDTKKVVRTWIAGEYQEQKLNNGWIIPHPTFFVKKDIYNKYGLFNPEFKIAADYELLLRLLKFHKIKLRYIKGIIVSMRNGGVSTRNLEQRKKGWQELKAAWTINNLPVPFLFIARRVFFKIKQYL